MPWCYKNVVPGPFGELTELLFERKEQDVPSPNIGPADAIVVLKKDRQCRLWQSFHPGRTLDQHYDEWRMLEIEKMRREQTELMMRIMEDHKQITENLAEISESQASLQEAEGATNTRFNVLFVIIASLTFLLALTPLAYPDGIDWIVDHAPGATNNQALVEVAPTPGSSPSVVAPTPTLSLGSTPLQQGQR
ncbi:MAG: hypothetical protein V3S20_04885 [Dehalococcoidia bacterium]